MVAYTATVLFCIFSFTSPCQRTGSIYSYLSDKTPYRFNANTDVADVNEDESECATKIWMLIRHGSRNPSEADIIDMNNRLPEIKNAILGANIEGNGILDSNEVNSFEEWTPNVQDVQDEHILVPEGEVENYEMAQRMQQRYPYALPSVFNNDTYLFKFTDNQRTRESAKYFAMGLFGEENLDSVYFPEPDDEDLLLLRFYKLCSKWLNEVSENPAALVEKNLFEATDIYQEAIERVNQAIGLTNELSSEDVQLMYVTCSFETAWYRNITSPWCLPFDEDTIKVFEYAEDLSFYWIDGYGFELNYKQACPTFRDMIQLFDDDDSQRNATLYFTHSGTLLKFMAHLGLYSDGSPLLYSNYGTNDDRNFCASNIDNFATNVAFILHTCGDSKMISVRQNEHIVRLPACPDSDLCDFEIVKEYYEDSINNCNFDEMCENSG